MANKSNLRICIVSFPTGFSEVYNIFLNDLVKILYPSCNSLYLITSNFFPDTQLPDDIIYIDLRLALHKKGVIQNVWFSHIMQFFKIFCIQLKMSGYIIRESSKTDIVFFYLGGGDIVLPLIVSKLLGKKVITSGIGQFSKTAESSYIQHFSMKSLLSKIYYHLEIIAYSLADRIVVESPRIISFIGIENFQNKIIPSGIRYIDTNMFISTKNYNDRKKVIGFIGRFSEEKGVLNFLSAIPLLLSHDPELLFIIAGDGHLLPLITDTIAKNSWKDRIILKGWINDRNNVASFLNELKILVIPSTSEGVPTILLEAMACETLVIATGVGGIPDIIKDGESGFIMKNNSPEQIAKCVLKVLTNKKIEGIIKYARERIETNYQLNNAVERYAKIIGEFEKLPTNKD